VRTPAIATAIVNSANAQIVVPRTEMPLVWAVARFAPIRMMRRPIVVLTMISEAIAVTAANTKICNGTPSGSLLSQFCSLP